MSNISWMYRNLANNPSAIIDVIGTSNTDFGSSRLADNNLKSYWSANSYGTYSILFDMGSSVYVDSFVVVNNVRIGTMYVKVGDTNPPTAGTYGLPLYTFGTTINYIGTTINYRYFKFFLNNAAMGDTILSGWYGGGASTPVDNVIDNNQGYPLWMVSGTNTIYLCGHEAGEYDFQVRRVRQTAGTNESQSQWLSRIGWDDYVTMGYWSVVTCGAPAAGYVYEYLAHAIGGGNSVGYFEGGTGGITKVYEVFIGKRDVFPINPEYPFHKKIDSATIVTESEKGQKKVYSKYTRRGWGFSYNSINDALNGTMNKIRNYCNGSYKPFFMCLDKDDNPYETFFCRFVKNSFKHSETMVNCHDIDFEIEEEL